VNEQSAPSSETAATAIYVYGVVPPDTPPTVFEDVEGVDPREPTILVSHAGLAAVAGRVPLDEFGEDALAANLRSADWLEAKVRAHDDVLAAAVGRTTVVPFRFGAIYESEDHVREMLADRSDLAGALKRLAGAVELGVNAYLDRERFRTQLAAERGVAEGEGTTGRAYMQRRALERELDASVHSFAAEVADDAHERLAARATDARANPVRPSVDDGRREMILNGAYLVASESEPTFRATASELGAQYAGNGVVFELTGPWPPYNFAESDER
jgi:gas vesicle protein GvpL/GvpF